jgi:hypothetical protein
MVDVSTSIADSAPLNGIDPCDVLRSFLFGLGDVRCLLGPEHLATRLTVLDKLDFIIGDLDIAVCMAYSDPQIIAHANVLRSQFEAANEKLFVAVRSELALQGKSRVLHRWLMGSMRDQGTQSPQPGLGFDLLDEVVSGVLKLSEPGDVSPLRSPEMVPYQPTPARHVLELITAANLSSDDVLVDLGSGLGHVSLLVSILARSRTVGVEFQPSYVACAQESARKLKLSRVEFVAGDARESDLTTGTVFYLFSPFKGSILSDMLQRLLRESNKRQIRICSLGPCTRVLQEQLWLKPRTRPNSEQINVFDSQ